MPSTGFVLRAISSAHLILSSTLLGYTVCRCSCQPFCSDGACRYTLLCVGLWLSSFAWLWTKQNPGLAKSSFEDPNQADLHPTKFSGQSMPLTWFCGWTKLLVGTATWPLWVGTQCAKIQVLVVASPFLLLCHRLPVVEPHRFSWNP